MMANNSSPNLACYSTTNENMSTCTAFDDEIENHYEGKQDFFEGKFLKAKCLRERFSRNILEKQEYLAGKSEYFSVKDDSSNEGQSCKVEAKVEYKIEESDSAGDLLEHGWQEKHEVFDDDEEEDDVEVNTFRAKQEYSDDDKSSENYKKCVTTSFEGNQRVNLKVQLKEMIDFLIEHYGRIRDTDLTEERKKYQSNPVLANVFEVLYSKYACTFKTRAEIVKYITRKAFSTIKNNSKKESDANSKEACKALCKRYFQVSSEEIQNSGVDIENRERFLQLLFPYQKNSKNKLQDMELISKLMSSKEFYQDYCLYVQELESILETDNNRKLSKFITFIITCINKGQIGNIMKYKRVPWLKAWLDNTKIVARELAFSIQWKGQQTSSKKVKKEKTDKKVESQ